MEREETAGFERSRTPEPGWATDLKVRHGLSVDASLREMEDTAVELLSSPLTAISRAELVLGRRVDAKDEEVASIITSFGLSGRDKFGDLLMQLEVEETRQRELKSR